MAPNAQVEELLLRWEQLQAQGQTLSAEELCRECPEYRDELARRIRALRAMRNVLEIVDTGPDCQPAASELEMDGLAANAPDRLPVIGRFRIEKILGEGGIGRVYLAHDDELQRRVAIKVPHRHQVASEDAAAYLAEARVLASLDHPHIVPVYDVGHTEDGLCFVVSKFIEGSDLKRKLEETRLSCTPAAELVAAVAEALHYAHRKGVVHRDVKPGNILIDRTGKPFVADFGLALKEEEWGKGVRGAGTPAYMSPEQARGEGHRVDGRSDIFSLGVVFYELLTGRRPFSDARWEALQELLEQIATVEVRPPRQIEDTIPKALERICLKALAKRASERYTTAKDLADDLRHFLVQQSGSQSSSLDRKRVAPSSNCPSLRATATPPVYTTPCNTPTSDSQLLRIVPKGLRSFDAHDADFFLELLPGPRDREGLPESIRFWKTRIEETDPDRTFSVGLIYGPSGCGKSSLVKAGLLPRLAEQILAVYIEVERPDALGRQAVRPQPLPLAERPSDGRDEQKQFLEHAVYSLAQDGKVICVRLALFAEMVKGKPWTPATLREMGGVEGVGVTFLEETVSSRTASPERRYHQQAARAILKGLLPESGTDIKGHMRSQRELLEASGYASRPRNFDDLIRILDAELRLITPTDPEGNDDPGEPGDVSPRSSDARFYQLTHDYLVPSLRDWLTRKQKETRGGRAELLLEDCANLWNARKEDRPLPTFEQWKEILQYTRQDNWTERQRNMMANANAYHARSLWERLLHANTAALPAMVNEMQPYRDFIEAPFREAFHQFRTNQDPRIQLHASLALLPVDATQVDYLYSRLLEAEPTEVPVLRDFLAAHRETLVERLWAVLDKPQKDKERQRLRAAAALATYDPQGQRWKEASGKVVEDLVTENSIHLGVWSEAFRPVKARLLSPLSAIFRDHQPERTAERTQATNLLVDYAADNPPVLADLLMDADEKQFAVLFPKFKERSDEALPILTAEIDRKLPPDLPSSDEQREKLAQRQASAAVALLRLNQPAKVWPLLKRNDKPDDPSVRSCLIHRLSPLGADAGAIIKRLDEEPDVTIRRALVLSLGEFPGDAVVEKDALVGKLLTMYRDAADAGLHGAAEWLLRQWQQQDKLQEIAQKLKKEQEPRMTSIRQYLANRDASASGASAVNDARWYVNSEGQTMVVVPGPVTFQMGSPAAEAGREGRSEGEVEQQHQEVIRRSYAIATKAVTVEEFRRFRRQHESNKQYAPHPSCPMNLVTWYDAAAYCDWLSKREGLESVYQEGPDGTYGPGMKVKANYLQLTGYRLPTETEWEYACRSGALTSRYYGETEELLGNYAWYMKHSLDRWMLPVGSLKPNDLGLFDMLGNVLQWCEDRLVSSSSGANIEDDIDIKNINKDDPRALRGGSFFNPALYVRSAVRRWYVPTVRSNNTGFRPARTFTPLPLYPVPPKALDKCPLAETTKN